MVWNFKLPAAMLLLVGVNGYGPSAPRLELVLLKDNPTDEEMMRDAPILIIGKVLSQDGIGPVLANKWRLVEVKTDVENKIRGDAGGAVCYLLFPLILGSSFRQ